MSLEFFLVLKSFNGVSRKRKGCFKLKLCSKEVSRMFQESFKVVYRKFKECFKEVSRVFQGNFRGISIVLEESFKSV